MPHAPAPIPITGQPAFDFSHMVALITGGSSGLGEMTARLFARLGAAVAITGRREDRLKAVAQEIDASGKRVLALVGDVRDKATPARWVDDTVKHFGKLTCLVNNAGVIGTGSTLTSTDEEWDRLMDTNVHALMRMTRAAAPKLVEAPKADSPAIINVGSVTGIRPYANLLGYCTSKAAVNMMTGCMALDLAPEGVRVNGINPGVVRSELHISGKVVDDYDAFLARAKETHPLNRPGEPEDVAWTVAFLASREAAWITGQNLACDGGRACTSLR